MAAPVRRTWLLALAAEIVAVAPPARAEPPRHVAVADLGLHVIGVGLQRTVHRRVAVQAALEWYVPWTHEPDLFTATGGVVRVRAFVYREAAPAGLWVSPFAQAGLAAGLRDGERQVGPAWALGLSAGYAWLFARHVHLAVGAGLQYEVADVPGGDGTPSFATLHPAIDLVLGWAF